MVKLERYRATIAEQSDGSGWLLSIGDCRNGLSKGRCCYSSANAARLALGKFLEGRDAVTTLTWEPATSIGTSVVKVLVTS